MGCGSSYLAHREVWLTCTLSMKIYQARRQVIVSLHDPFGQVELASTL